MAVGAVLEAWFARVTRRRSRRILIAGVATLLVSGSLLALVSASRWRQQRALAGDTHAIAAQVSQQLLRALTSRRGTLTFIRDTLNRRPDLTLPQLQAMGASAREHTRHLLGTGLLRATQLPVWWSGPQNLSPAELAQLNRAIVQRSQLRGVWRVPSTFIATMRTQHHLLVMLEPLRASTYRQSALIGVFDFTPLLEDFFASNLPQRQPVQLFDTDTLLYRSGDWAPTTTADRPIIPPPLSASAAPKRSGAANHGLAARPPPGGLAKRGGGIIEERPVVIDAERWTLQMQPGSTSVTRTLSWFTVLLVSLSIVAGLGITVIVWILAARTWILQRAVARRTAALRRTSERLRQLATTDELTGLHNRRFFLDRWQWEYERAKRYQRPLACLMVDVNGFKQVNDRLGHQVGDLVLKEVAKELQAALRQSDILARLGGDEFIIALPETSASQAALVAEKLRKVNIPVPNPPGRGVPPVSLSVGMSHATLEHENAEAMLRVADQSLYASKRQTKTVRAST